MPWLINHSLNSMLNKIIIIKTIAILSITIHTLTIIQCRWMNVPMPTKQNFWMTHTSMTWMSYTVTVVTIIIMNSSSNTSNQGYCHYHLSLHEIKTTRITFHSPPCHMRFSVMLRMCSMCNRNHKIRIRWYPHHQYHHHHNNHSHFRNEEDLITQTTHINNLSQLNQINITVITQTPRATNTIALYMTLSMQMSMTETAIQPILSSLTQANKVHLIFIHIRIILILLLLLLLLLYRCNDHYNILPCTHTPHTR